jgi:hypothetical protein
MKTTTHKDSLDVCAALPLEDYELDSVSGGTPALGGIMGGGGPMGLLNEIMQIVQQPTKP